MHEHSGNNHEKAPVGAPCPRCEQPMEAATVRTAVWRGDRLFVVEDIPAQICAHCKEQFYDEAVTEALRRLTAEAFASATARREILVPIYSLEGRIAPMRKPSEEELHADY